MLSDRQKCQTKYGNNLTANCLTIGASLLYEQGVNGTMSGTSAHHSFINRMDLYPY